MLPEYDSQELLRLNQEYAQPPLTLSIERDPSPPVSTRDLQGAISSLCFDGTSAASLANLATTARRAVSVQGNGGYDLFIFLSLSPVGAFSVPFLCTDEVKIQIHFSQW